MHPATIGPFQILRELGRGGMGYGSTFAPDGRLMVVLQGEGEQTTHIDLVVNFLEDVRAKMAAAASPGK